MKTSIRIFCWSWYFSRLGRPPPLPRAGTPSPGFTIDSYAQPTHFSTAQNAECLGHASEDGAFDYCDAYLVAVTNSGSEPTDGPVTLTDTVPAGLTIQESGPVRHGCEREW